MNDELVLIGTPKAAAPLNASSAAYLLDQATQQQLAKFVERQPL